MKKILDTLIVCGFCAILFAVPILTKLEPPSDFSQFENRSLAAAPVFTVGDFFGGGYLPKWNDYLSDHIWKRDYLIAAYTLLNHSILRKPVVNDVVVQKDVLLPFIPYAAEAYDFTGQIDAMAGRLALLNETVEGCGGKFIYVGVPEQYSMLRDMYPKYLNNDGERLTLIEDGFFSALEENGIDYINMRDEFLEAGDFGKYYSKTDHHYNLLGAYKTYETMIDRLNGGFSADLPVLRNIVFAELDNPFYGSRNRKLYKLYSSNERLYYYDTDSPVPFKRSDYGISSVPEVFAMPEGRDDGETPVSYLLYMGGDMGVTVIETDRPHLPNALIFGDSFTNPLETFLYNSFNTTVSIDLRHYSEKTILEYIADFKPDYVFCLRDDTCYLSPDGNGNIR